jgi:hypothetical protein
LGFLFHNKKFAVVDVSQVFKVLHCPLVPLHEKNSTHEAVSDKDADAGKIIIAKLSPETLVEAANSIVGIRCRLAVWDAIEKVTIICTFLPHSLHLNAT